MSSIAPSLPLSPSGHAAGAPWSGFARLVATTFLFVIVMNVAHEAGHAFAAKLLGYDVLASLNHVRLVPGAARSDAHRIMIDLAGPAVTIAIAIAAWVAARRGAVAMAPILLFVALAMRLIAAVASLAAPNDEARASMLLGAGKWTLFALVLALLLALFLSIYRRLPLGWRWLVGAYVGASLGFAAVVFGEPFLPAISL